MADKVQDMQAEIDRLKAQLAQASKPQALSLKVSDKGGVSVYGLGRFPVTLYGTQWERLLAASPQITAFMAANKSKLTTKA
ncbi:MAG: hypothetical protein E6J01_18015 [Chloroflexi bacterium]|nr:MAG: hypothetical protein E6J01_18015 [Chloroflexota bacterium]